MTTEKSLSLEVDHQVSLARYSTTVVQRILALLVRTERDILAQLGRLSTSGSARSAARLAALQRRLDVIRSTMRQGYQLIGRQLRSDLMELSAEEVDWQEELHRRALGMSTRRPSLAELRAAALSRPFQGRILREWVRDLEAGAVSRLTAAVRMGYVEGESTEQIVRRVRGTARLNYEDGILVVSRRGAESMVRTAVTHMSVVAREEFLLANRSQFRGVQWVSVLDTRTTPVCRSRDGQIYPLGRGPRPPAHIRCRSTIIGVPTGMPQAQVPSYADWLEDQSSEVQDDILGPTRGRLYRQGGLTVDQFTDSTGRQLTLEQLRVRRADAFRRAGL